MTRYVYLMWSDFMYSCHAHRLKGTCEMYKEVKMSVDEEEE